MLMIILKLINNERMFLMLVHNFISLYDSTHELSSSSLSPAPQRENTGGENS